jgi:polyhydroxyalkanoate synthesis regulator phasin
MLEKISEAQVNHIMIKAASALRAQQARIGELEQQVASYKRRDHAEKIASTAVNRGIMEEDEAGSYANDLANSSEDLNLVEDFVSRAAAGVPLGKTLEKTAAEHGGEGGESDVLTAFLLSSDIAG